MEWINWFSKDENTKPLALLIFFITFCLILIYVFGSKKRGERLESHKDIPFLDEDSDTKEVK
ncbi:MAG: CcoQ/FixQ family Cbb3-type cytochrome c oxidase assembly chaperone [Sulfurimicrobium sp.]|jgi:cbb3-type cytochrome oxidase subunit 3|nr:CcoQ/FixQ family Cbb3-type cytochrome c oxidase assembly chaperone [Sulfurimicrobium sp.]MDO9188391.1 CcoQ/FixQ family Cbb3-type cytochrome c oxidase assembly chaperone [Sulfurimicrobium sp.]MDP1704856.1 CcoQ/FixQ family Cbb3-type cytochrome c oxidase assembly chaperone [Sulfurimicrobium sp.]MDP2200156.1 CcoQ/FixQ family Cbb3-type cytochrome c oxidase assembly chaperone [Sulfurimicrobium sp.]MDP2961822.1 CcoQ/FixQ family Cbb3-type cytochrome c oxidase assembly chaperone [Sulfurimicrobium sp.